MAYTKRNPNGQEVMANSSPVTIASDQSAVPVSATAFDIRALSSTEDEVKVHGSLEILQQRALTSSNPLDVAIMDGNGDQVTVFNTAQVDDESYTQSRVTIAGGVRKDEHASPVSADGDVHPFVFNSQGRLKVSTLPAAVDATTGTITANGQTIEVDTSRISNLMFHVTGTFSTVNCIFEGSVNGGSNWFTVQAVRSSANTIETTTGNLSASPAYAWEASVNGLTHFRIRATAFTSGTQNWTFLPGIYATEPIPAAQVSGTQPISGTVTASNTAGNVAHDTADSGNPVKNGMKAQTTLSGLTLVAAADRTDMFGDVDGVQIIKPWSTYADYVNGNASNTDGTSTQVLAAQGANVKAYITDVTITNTSASNIYVELKDGTTVKWTFPVPANSGVTHHFGTPLGGTANTAWNFDPSAATTTVYCSVSGFKSKV